MAAAPKTFTFTALTDNELDTVQNKLSYAYLTDSPEFSERLKTIYPMWCARAKELGKLKNCGTKSKEAYATFLKSIKVLPKVLQDYNNEDPFVKRAMASKVTAGNKLKYTKEAVAQSGAKVWEPCMKMTKDELVSMAVKLGIPKANLANLTKIDLCALIDYHNIEVHDDWKGNDGKRKGFFNFEQPYSEYLAKSMVDPEKAAADAELAAAKSKETQAYRKYLNDLGIVL